MTFTVEAYIECSQCESQKTPNDYSEGYAAEDFEDFNPQEFEDAAIDYFKNEGWTRAKNSDKWTCPNH